MLNKNIQSFLVYCPILKPINVRWVLIFHSRNVQTEKQTDPEEVLTSIPVEWEYREKGNYSFLLREKKKLREMRTMRWASSFHVQYRKKYLTVHSSCIYSLSSTFSENVVEFLSAAKWDPCDKAVSFKLFGIHEYWMRFQTLETGRQQYYDTADDDCGRRKAHLLTFSPLYAI